MTADFIPAGWPCIVLDDAIEHPFVVGDIVTRMGADEQEVIGVNWAGDLIDVRCIKAPPSYDDAEPWCKVGDVESNLSRRYALVRPAAKRLPPPVITTASAHGLQVGDVVSIDLAIPRPPWWQLIALYRWWRNPLRELRTYTVVAAVQVDVTTMADEQPRVVDGLHLEER